MYKPRRAEPTIVYTPLPSREKARKQRDAARRKKDQSDETQGVAEDGSTSQAHVDATSFEPRQNGPYLRAENEDDDGYDPYSDRREESPLFERNPWD